MPKRFWLGIILILLFWFLNWNLEGLRTQWAFFPMWLGYAVTIDALVFKRKGSSLFSRNKILFAGLFFLSVPVWWLFELFNQITHNWMYMGREYFSDMEYFLLASLSFSTVIPSVFGTAELVSTFLKPQNKNFKISDKPKTGYIFISVGIFMLVLLIIFPRVFYVFIWTAVFFIVEGINILIRNRSLLTYINNGNWKPVFSLLTGCLICGFFWEFWNYYSYPKWIYDVPGFNFWHIFEMPLPGYLGYIPFSFELFSLYHLFVYFTGKEKLHDFVELS